MRDLFYLGKGGEGVVVDLGYCHLLGWPCFKIVAQYRTKSCTLHVVGGFLVRFLTFISAGVYRFLNPDQQARELWFRRLSELHEKMKAAGPGAFADTPAGGASGGGKATPARPSAPLATAGRDMVSLEVLSAHAHVAALSRYARVAFVPTSILRISCCYTKPPCLLSLSPPPLANTHTYNVCLALLLRFTPNNKCGRAID